MRYASIQNPSPQPIRIDLSEADVDQWREAVLHGSARPLRAEDREHIDALWREAPTGEAFGTTPLLQLATAYRDACYSGDVALNDAAVEAADAPSPIDWQPEPHGHTGTAICVVIMLCTVAWATFRIVTSAGAA